MNKEQFSWRNALIALGALALLTIGLAIIVYVGLARERISPTPTAVALRTLSPVVQGTPTTTVSPTPQERVEGIVREYSPGALIIVLTPTEGTVEQVIVVETVQVAWADGRMASAREIAPGARIIAEGTLDALRRMVASRITIVEVPLTPTMAPSHTPPSPTVTVEGPTLTPTATPISSIPVQAWLGEYFNNPMLQGSPTIVRTDVAIDFQWHSDSPGLGLARDRFSVRWRGRWPLEAGGYRFYAYSDDGVRVWVDGAIVIDQWRDQGPTLAFGDLYLQTGEHTIQVEYYDQIQNAQVRVWWEYKGLYPDWRAEYYANRNLSGSPAVARNDSSVDFDWGQGAPAPGLPADNFSVRWTRTIEFEGGAYRFYARTDDGVRLWVDGPLVIDEWHDSEPRTYVGDIYLDGGPHNVRIEFYEGSGRAYIQVWWEKIDQFTDWMGEYFANPDVTGRPALVRNDQAIDMDWGSGSPGSGMPADRFSVRWSRTVTLASGAYRFWVVADDGARVYVQGALLIDAWSGPVGTVHEAQFPSSGGAYPIVVEYRELGGRAFVRMGWELVPTPTSTSTVFPTATQTTVPTSTQTTAPTSTQTTAPTSTSTPQPPTATVTTGATTAVPTETVAPPTATPTATFTVEPSTVMVTTTPTPGSGASALNG